MATVRSRVMTLRKWGVEQLVNTNTNDFQTKPAIASTPDGGFVIVWTNNDPADDGSLSSVKMQRYDATDRVATNLAADQFAPDLAILKNGEVAISFTSDNGPDSNIAAFRFFAASGTQTGGIVNVAISATNNEIDGASATLADGGFAV